MRPEAKYIVLLALPLAMGACSSTPSRRAQLDCPAGQGQLTRTQIAADGHSCAYTTAQGDQVNLRLVPVASTPEAALAPIETELLPPTKASVVQPNDGDSDRADLSLPGLQVHASDQKAEVTLGGLHVDAGEDGAIVRTAHKVRLRGQPFALQQRGYKASFLVARDDLPGGDTAVGYQAGGPITGPLAVAVVHARRHDQDHLQSDIAKLVRRNGGV